jgi:hypothetical protein
MDTTEIEAAFRDWWEESYKRPPNAQAVMTHVAFAAYMFQPCLRWTDVISMAHPG